MPPRRRAVQKIETLGELDELITKQKKSEKKVRKISKLDRYSQDEKFIILEYLQNVKRNVDELTFDDINEILSSLNPTKLSKMLEKKLYPPEPQTGYHKCPVPTCGSMNTRIIEQQSSSTDEGSFQVIICQDCGQSTRKR